MCYLSLRYRGPFLINTYKMTLTSKGIGSTCLFRKVPFFSRCHRRCSLLFPYYNTPPVQIFTTLRSVLLRHLQDPGDKRGLSKLYVQGYFIGPTLSTFMYHSKAGLARGFVRMSAIISFIEQ